MSKTTLFVPCEDRKLAKLASLAAPVVMIDLEDGISQTRKEAARKLLEQSVTWLYTQQPCWVRVNGFETEQFYQDLAAAVRPGLLGINLPKVETALQLQITDWYLSQLERTRQMPLGSVRLMATIETARGLEAALEIARSTVRLERLCAGNADYSRDLGLDWPAPNGGINPAVEAAQLRLVQVSAAVGLLPPHDGPSAEFRNLEAVAAEARAARQRGFGGKQAIHPAQLPVLEQVFAPTQAQIDWAGRVLAYHRQHPEQGAFQIDGQMVDAPVMARAQQIMAEVAQQNPPDEWPGAK